MFCAFRERRAQNNIIMANGCRTLATCKGKKLAAFFYLQTDSVNRILHPKDRHRSRGVQSCLAPRIVCEGTTTSQAFTSTVVLSPCPFKLDTIIKLDNFIAKHVLQRSSMHLASSSVIYHHHSSRTCCTRLKNN